MSSPAAFRGLPEPQMTELSEGLVLIEHSDPGARHSRLSTNSYAILQNGRSVLVDTGFSFLVPFVRQLADRGFAPAALVITHRHVAGNGDSVQAIHEDYKVPVLLHPIDARHPQSRGSRVPFENPVGHPVLAELGLEAILFPGHTEGHIILYGAAHGGFVVTGDAAMGTTARQAEEGVERLVRPPAQLSTDDDELRQQWLAFKRPVVTVLPYHGTGYVNRAPDIARLMAPLTRAQPTIGFE